MIYSGLVLPRRDWNVTNNTELNGAVHALTGKAYKRPKDAIGNFNKDYVKTEIFSRETGRKISEAEEIRHASDYDDFYIASKEEAYKQIETANLVLDKVKEYLKING